MVALGLAIGIGLVMIVSATSAGVKTAQSQVLHSLYGVGTDITVTKTASPGTGGKLHFGGFGSSSSSQSSTGRKIARDSLRTTPGEGTLPSSDVTKVAKLTDVSAASGGLVLTDTAFTGTIPSSSSTAGKTPANGSTGTGGPSFNISSVTVEGIEITSSGVGPLESSEVTKGAFFSSTEKDSDVAIVSSSYAKSDKLRLGSTLTVGSAHVKVIGIADVTSGSDVYLPLATAQKLSGDTDKVTDIYVSAKSASVVGSLASEVKTAVPKSTVATAASLAKEVTGSISSASNLATRLGKWLSIAALAVAFLLAGLLMASAVARRTRELGTLKAIGWRTRRLVRQVLGEGLVVGIAGGLVGILLGVAGSEVVSAVAPSLTATVGAPSTTGGGFAGAPVAGNGGRGRPFSTTGAASGHHGLTAVHTVLVHLSAPIQGGTLGIALALAVAGGLVAGGFGAWRAARLQPAAALRKVD